MSNVYKRFYGTTDIKFLIIALDLQVAITQYCVKEKLLPKKYRFIFALPLINKVNELVDNAVFGNSIYPTTPEKLAEREMYQTRAIANCYQLQNLIIAMENTVNTVNIDNLDVIIELLCEERNLLLAWKKSNKIQTKKETNEEQKMKTG